MIYPVLTWSRNLGDFPHDLEALHACGLKAIRLIYKGKTEAEFNARIREIQREINAKKLAIDILVDLPGKKPIVGDLGKGLAVRAGLTYRLTDHTTPAALQTIPTANLFDHAQFPELAPGALISIADDELNMVVQEIGETAIVCEALNSFHLTSNRSLGVKNTPFAVAANSGADCSFVRNLRDVPANVKLVVSFMRTAGDLLHLKALQPAVELIPKIEMPLNDADLLAIMDCCDTVMLGRGDLSIVCSPNELFAFQSRLIELCRDKRKKLIIGTGLLTGIGDKQAPAIAEVMDYAYLRSRGIEAFLIAGSNALHQPLKTLEFMRDFEKGA